MFKISRVGLHNYEEPIISGDKGSGTIFFCGCNLKCIYCQNYEISRGEKGIVVDDNNFIDLMFYLQEQGAHNINLVTPSLYIKRLSNVLKIAKDNGLKIPIVYNTSSYESVKSLKWLEGLVDVYLPDFKYSDDNLALRFSNAKDYSKVAYEAICEMHRQQPKNEIRAGLIKKGVVVRHLVLPNFLDNTKGVFKKIAQIDKKITVSVMAQYFPTSNVKGTTLDRRLSEKEYDTAIDAFFAAGLKNGFMQDLESGIEDYVPIFDLNELQCTLENCKKFKYYS